MPKYKVDFHVVRIEVNKVEVKDNSGKLCWYHISDVKKTDMISKLYVSYLILMDSVEKAALVLIQNMFKILVGHQITGNIDLILIMSKILQEQLKTLLDRDLIQCN